MSASLLELKTVISGMILEEARKKKTKKTQNENDETDLDAAGSAWGQYAAQFDFSRPLGSSNLYAKQGAANFGPYTTGPGASVGAENDGAEELDESVVRLLVRTMIRESDDVVESAWDKIEEAGFADENFKHGPAVVRTKGADGTMHLCAECLYRLAKGDTFSDEENGDLSWDQIISGTLAPLRPGDKKCDLEEQEPSPTHEE